MADPSVTHHDRRNHSWLQGRAGAVPGELRRVGFPEVALARLLVKAAGLGANAIIGLRYAMSVNLHVSMSCMAYGTAVWVDYA
jgi:uncharacterized protein YbjQ (UPF0145 family)